MTAGPPRPTLAGRGADGLDPWREPGVTTLVADAAVLRAWRTGPRWWHVVVASISDSEVERRRMAVAAQLDDLVAPWTPGQPHVTLWAAGFDVVPRLPLRRTVALTVGAPATFESAVYLAVHSPEVALVRDELGARNPAEHREGAFTPHVTVGTYRAEVPFAHARQRLAAVPWQPPVSVTARVEHLVVDTRTDRLAPPPR